MSDEPPRGGTPFLGRRLIEEDPKPGDHRSPFQVDRDRVLYSSALRRLAEVGQVVSATEGHVFHNRLTHSLKVAQLSRRIAERLVASPGDLSVEFLPEPEAAEAAALAHDLGHPPFGHVAKRELDRLVIQAGNHDGFEGNAQSFRILTRLAVHSEGRPGLNLTRRTLSAVLKYPWMRGRGGASSTHKFGAYDEDSEAFQFARSGRSGAGKTIEAAIMDFADSVTYSVHDLFDFYQAGLIPVWEVSADPENALRPLTGGGKVSRDEVDLHRDAIMNLIAFLPKRAYRGGKSDRLEVRTRSSWLINEFVRQVRFPRGVGGFEHEVPLEVRLRMRFLQNLVWRYVIQGPGVASQQLGQVRIVRSLYRTYRLALGEGIPHALELVPHAYQDQIVRLRDRW